MTQEFTVSHRNVATIQHDVDFAVVNLLSRDQRIRGALDSKQNAPKVRFAFPLDP